MHDAHKRMPSAAATQEKRAFYTRAVVDKMEAVWWLERFKLIFTFKRSCGCRTEVNILTVNGDVHSGGV